MSLLSLTVARDAVAVTPSDSAVFAPPLNGIYVGSIAGGATLTVITPAGNSVTFAAVVAGTVIPLQAKQIMATGTLATAIVGFK